MVSLVSVAPLSNYHLALRRARIHAAYFTFWKDGLKEVKL